MGKGSDHALPAAGNEKALRYALMLTGGFMLAEVIGGVMLNSLALLSDAAHMFTDVAVLAIALAAIRVGRRAVDDRRTFGYHRFEILAAAFNALLLFGVAAYILYEAWQRWSNPPAVQTTGVLVIAVLGTIVNLVSMRLLSSGKDSSLNVKGAYLEVWSDLLGSIGVIVGTLVIRFTGWNWVGSSAKSKCQRPPWLRFLAWWWARTVLRQCIRGSRCKQRRFCPFGSGNLLLKCLP
jgi:cobalt-zinc-cadmium efflux system protein